MNFDKLQVINAVLTLANIMVMMFCVFVIKDNNIRWWLIRLQFTMVLAQFILVVILVREIMRDW